MSGSPGGPIPWVAEPYRLWSLPEIMNAFRPDELASHVRLLEIWQSTGPPDAMLQGKHISALLGQLERVWTWCVHNGFDGTAGLVQQLLQSLYHHSGQPLSVGELSIECSQIQRVLVIELGGPLFLYLTRKEAEHYENPREGWGLAEKRFRKAVRDIEEASKCLAFNRGTATVFHLMRIMEAGLVATAKVIDIPYAPSWESYLRQMQKQLDLLWDKRSEKLRKNEQYVREVHGLLSAVKVTWRNPTVHVRRDYTLEEAEEVYGAVKSFMRHLSTLPIRKRV